MAHFFVHDVVALNNYEISCIKRQYEKYAVQSFLKAFEGVKYRLQQFNVYFWGRDWSCFYK